MSTVGELDIQDLYEEFAMSKYVNAAHRDANILLEVKRLRAELAQVREQLAQESADADKLLEIIGIGERGRTDGGWINVARAKTHQDETITTLMEGIAYRDKQLAAAQLYVKQLREALEPAITALEGEGIYPKTVAKLRDTMNATPPDLSAIEGMMRDAERYRWLRESQWIRRKGEFRPFDSQAYIQHKELDELTDAAIAASKGDSMEASKQAPEASQ